MNEPNTMIPIFAYNRAVVDKGFLIEHLLNANNLNDSLLLEITRLNNILTQKQQIINYLRQSKNQTQ